MRRGHRRQSLTWLSKLVEVETFPHHRAATMGKVRKENDTFSRRPRQHAYCHRLGVGESAADYLAALKKLRSKLGTVKHGLTEKNRTLLRRFDDTRLLENLARLPDRLWRTATT